MRRLSRRDLAWMLGTSAFATPLLWRYGRALAEGARATAPKRLMIFWNPQGHCSGLALNGVDPFWPTGTETSLIRS